MVKPACSRNSFSRRATSETSDISPALPQNRKDRNAVYVILVYDSTKREQAYGTGSINSFISWHSGAPSLPVHFCRYIAAPTAGHSTIAMRASSAGLPLNGLPVRPTGVLVL